MRQSLQTGIDRVKAMETELTVRETNWSKHVFRICSAAGNNDRGLKLPAFTSYSVPIGPSSPR